jgi:transcriptional regulator with XRE-family HTH domain
MKHITTLPELGAEVARLRRQHGLTQTQLGTLAGLGQSTLARFETGGVAEFGSRKLLRLLDTLGYGVQFVATAREFTLDDALRERQSQSPP